MQNAFDPTVLAHPSMAAERIAARLRGNGAASDHAGAVAALVAETTLDEDLTIAALLHDLAEGSMDSSPVREVESWFGYRVARVVAACSEFGAHPAPPFRDLDEFRVAEALCAPRDVVLVLSADATAALDSLAGQTRSGGGDLAVSGVARETSVWFYGELAAALCHRLGAHPLTQRLTESLQSFVDACATAVELTQAS